MTRGHVRMVHKPRELNDSMGANKRAKKFPKNAFLGHFPAFLFAPKLVVLENKCKKPWKRSRSNL